MAEKENNPREDWQDEIREEFVGIALRYAEQNGLDANEIADCLEDLPTTIRAHWSKQLRQ
jgi:hypothetical protein